MKKLVIRPAAEEDIQAAYDWYSEQSNRAAEGLIESLDTVFNRIITNSGSGY